MLEIAQSAITRNVDCPGWTCYLLWQSHKNPDIKLYRPVHMDEESTADQKVAAIEQGKKEFILYLRDLMRELSDCFNTAVLKSKSRIKIVRK